MKKFFAMLLALTMIVSMAVPAMADDTIVPGGEVVGDAAIPHDHTITISHVDDTNEYAAYRIFAGTVETSEAGKTTLSDVSWGAGVDETKAAEIYAALANAEKNPTYYSKYAGVQSAAAVADVLSDNNNASHAAAFADVISAFLGTASATSKKAYDADSNFIGYTLSGLEDGYYLIKQISTGNPYATLSEYMMYVVKDVDTTAKDSSLTIEKYIVDGENMVTAADFSIGDTVPMELHATLPMWIDNYETYYLELKDTISQGLTLNVDSLVVKIDNDASLVTIDPEDYKVVVTDYAGTGASDPYAGGKVMQIIFQDLKDLKGKYTINYDTEIIAFYNATVNEHAEIGNPGNPNKVSLVFSNDPNSTGRGETPEDYVTVFTFELDVNKIDGETRKNLEGVKFKLYRKHTVGDEFAIIDANNKVTGWTTDEAQGTVLTTNAGGMLYIKGLEASEYWLREAESLEGYDKIDDVPLAIRATIDQANQKVTKLEIHRNDQAAQPGDVETGIVNLQIINNPGKELPTTGGMGTTLFYTVGGILVAAALILLVTKKRMSFEA